MELNLFNGLIKNRKNNDESEQLINELENFFEKDKIEENTNKLDRSKSLSEIKLEDENILTSFRDKMYIERNKILNNYATKTLDKGKMIYIYERNSKLDNGYNMCVCEEGQSHNIIEETSNKLPNGAGIGSVLRYINGKYILDMEATNEISKQISEMKQNLLKEQDEFLKSQRIEGHIYEVSEKSNDRVWLFDTNSNDDFAEAIEEIDFPKELLEAITEGDLVIFKNGSYEKY